METHHTTTLLNGNVWLERLGIFFKRELRVRASYRMTLVISMVNGISGILAYGLLGTSASASVTSAAYNMTLASYLVSGVAFSPIVTSGLTSFSQYASSTDLEEVLITPIGFRGYLLASSVFNTLTTLGGTAFFFGASVVILGLDFSYDFPLLAVAIILGLIISISVGFLALGMRLVYKQTSLLSWLLLSVTSLVGNMIVPVQVLPGIVQYISYLTPQYYFFTTVRIALGSSPAPLLPVLGLFAAYSAILLCMGLYVLSRGLRFVKRNGTHRWT